MRLKSKRGASHDDSTAPLGLAFEQEVLLGRVQERVRELLAIRGVTQKQLAQRLNLSAGRISQVVSGENLTLRTLASVGCALGYRFDIIASPIDEEPGFGTIRGRPSHLSPHRGHEPDQLYNTLADSVSEARRAFQTVFFSDAADPAVDESSSPPEPLDMSQTFRVLVKQNP